MISLISSFNLILDSLASSVDTAQKSAQSVLDSSKSYAASAKGMSMNILYSIKNDKIKNII